METKPSSEDILNAILPPREWVENGKFHFKIIFVIQIKSIAKNELLSSHELCT